MHTLGVFNSINKIEIGGGHLLENKATNINHTLYDKSKHLASLHALNQELYAKISHLANLSH